MLWRMSSEPIFRPGASKQEVVDRLHRHIGIREEALGPGSKERKSTFLAVASTLEISVPQGARKPEIASSICNYLGGTWDETCESAGDTVTLSGLNRLLELVELHFVRQEPLRPRSGKSEEAMNELDVDVDLLEKDVDEELELAIAEQISQLSQATLTPNEFGPPTAAVDPEDVDLRSQSWMTHLASVQGWLHLSRDLSLKDPDGFLVTLSEGLGCEDVSALIEVRDGRKQFNNAGLNRLSGALAQALRLQEDFLADSEADGGTLASATGRWILAWEEAEAEDEDDASGPVTAKAETWPINEFSDRAIRGKLNLSPSYQRADVWSTNESQMLIESILRGIPLPSVIILKKDGDAPYEVVDGKQRLTSILRFIGKHPRALEIVRNADELHPDEEFLELFENNYPKFRQKWKNFMPEPLTAAKERENYFPFRLRTGTTPLKGDLQALQGRYYTDIKNFQLKIADSTTEVRELFESVTEYKVPIIAYSKATRRQIHEVFKLYNKAGKHLNAEEIRNAVFNEVHLMRALMVVSGDIGEQNRISTMTEVAPFLTENWTELQVISPMLDDFGFGTARYKRCKVLSWLASMLFVDSIHDGRPRSLSTARQIDFLLERIETNSQDPMRKTDKITDALLLILRGMEAHAAVGEAFAPVFRDTKAGAKWQELQLVASLLGVCLAAVVLGDQTESTLIDVTAELYDKTNSESWKRPDKTQTNRQWEYIARIALQIMDIMGVDHNEASQGLEERFGFTCIPTLQNVVSNATIN